MLISWGLAESVQCSLWSLFLVWEVQHTRLGLCDSQCALVSTRCVSEPVTPASARCGSVIPGHGTGAGSSLRWEGWPPVVIKDAQCPFLLFCLNYSRSMEEVYDTL